MDILKKILFLLFLSSSHLYANAILEHTIVLKTKRAKIDTATPFMIECPVCLETIKKDDQEYTLRLKVPPLEEFGLITFNYYYGNNLDICLYQAKVEVMITTEGRLMGGSFGDTYGTGKLDAQSTFPGCPPVVYFRLRDNSSGLSTVLID